MTVGSKEVEGFFSMGTGFFISGIGKFVVEGKDFNIMKERFPWIRAILIIEVDKLTQTL